MSGDPTFGGGVLWALQTMGEIAFKWIPGTVLVMSDAAYDTTQAPLMPITQPVTTSDVAQFLQTAALPGAYDQLYHNWSILVAVSILISLLLGVGLIYCLVRIMQLRHNEHARFHAVAHTVASSDVSKTQLRWNRILEQIASDNDRDWRLAILEADIMLNELLDLRGYKGETMADKMKQVERGDFKTIDYAWEAHRMRNAVAHQGTLQDLSHREARHAIALYEQVFREFGFIA